MKVKKTIISGLLISLSLTGCGSTVEVRDGNTVFVAQHVGMEETPVIEYTVTEQIPNILVNIDGYASNDEKIAFVKGTEIPKNYEIVDVSKGKQVARGQITDVVYNENLRLKEGKIDFTDYLTTGEYYIRVENLGRSYNFEISENIYEKKYREILESQMEKAADRTLDVDNAYYILTTYEWYNDIFPDEDGDGIPDGLKELAAWVQACDEATLPEEMRSRFVAVLAKFSFLYQKYDKDYATECIKRASALYEKAALDTTKDEYTFMALAEIYRATGRRDYGSKIREYLTYFKSNPSYIQSRGYLWGGVVYLKTRQSVSMDLCTRLMHDTLDCSEDITKKRDDIVDLLNPANTGYEDVLDKAMNIACSNHVQKIYSYHVTIEEFVHYLSGRNILGQDVCTDERYASEFLLLYRVLCENSL